MNTNDLDSIIENIEDLEGFMPMFGAIEDQTAMESATAQVSEAMEGAIGDFWGKVQAMVKRIYAKVVEAIRRILEAAGKVINQVRVATVGKNKTVSVCHDALEVYKKYCAAESISPSFSDAKLKALMNGIGGEDFDSKDSELKSAFSTAMTKIGELRKEFHEALKKRKDAATVTVDSVQFLNAAKKVKSETDALRKTLDATCKAILGHQHNMTAMETEGKTRSAHYKNISKAASTLQTGMSAMLSYAGTQIAMAYSLIANRIGEKKKDEKAPETGLAVKQPEGALKPVETKESWAFDFNLDE